MCLYWKGWIQQVMEYLAVQYVGSEMSNGIVCDTGIYNLYYTIVYDTITTHINPMD